MSAKTAAPQVIDFTESEGSTITVYHKDSGGTLDFDFSGVIKEVVKGASQIATEAVKRPPVAQRERETLPMQPSPQPPAAPPATPPAPPVVTTPATRTPPPPPEPVSQGGASQMSTGAKVGIALGAAALLAAVYMASKGSSEPRPEKGLAV